MKNLTAFDKNLFIKAVKLANKEIFDYINNQISFEDYQYSNTIGFGGDNSLNFDLTAENIFIKHLEKFGNIYSEECGFLDRDSEYTIVIDPLDGSNNFLNNLPYYGTSVALKKDKKVVAGFVTNLISSVLTYKIFEDDVKYFSLKDNLYVKLENFSKSNLAVFERAYKFPNICYKLNENKIKFRCLGAVALSLCDARNYDFVLFGGEHREFDIAAALYICEDFFTHKSNKFVLISKNKLKFEQVLEIIKEI
jgi:myo-inositol-1(or 4)-monophosphatase